MNNIKYEFPKINEVVSIGKVTMTFSKKNKQFIFPRFHIIINKKKGPNEEEGFQVTCLELQLFSFGLNIEEAKKDILNLSIAFIEEIIQNESYNKLNNLLIDKNMEDYWALYRLVLFKLAYT